MCIWLESTKFILIPSYIPSKWLRETTWVARLTGVLGSTQACISLIPSSAEQAREGQLIKTLWRIHQSRLGPRKEPQSATRAVTEELFVASCIPRFLRLSYRQTLPGSASLCS